MKIAIIQFNSLWENKKENLQRAENFIKQASKKCCDLIVFPEMFLTGFSMNIPMITENTKGEAVRRLSSFAREFHINIIAGLALKSSRKNKPENMALIFNREGKKIAAYSKTHLFSPSGEDRYFLPGKKPIIFPIENIPASVFICYDLRFPEIFRRVAPHCRMIFVIANWPTSRKDHWETLLKARAIENQCFIIGVNRIGTDGNGLIYSGDSRIFNPFGDEITRENENEEMLICSLNPEETSDIRNKYPFLKDRRK